MNSQINSNDITEQFIINYLVDLSHTKRVNLLKKVTEKLCQFTDVDAAPAAAPAAPPNTPQLKPEPEPEQEQKAEPELKPEPVTEPEQKIEDEPEQKIELPITIPEVYSSGLIMSLLNRKLYFVIAISDCTLGSYLVLECTDEMIKLLRKSTGDIISINLIGTNDWESLCPEFVSRLRKQYRKNLKAIDIENNLTKIRDVNHPEVNYFTLKKLNIKYALLEDNTKIEILDLLPFYWDVTNPGNFELAEIRYETMAENIKPYMDALKSYIKFEIKPMETCPCCLEDTNVYVDKCKHPLCNECFLNITKQPGQYYKRCPLCRDEIKKLSKKFVKRNIVN